MENLSISATQYTPEVKFNPSGKLTFKGKSYPENSLEFYKPVMAWLRAFIAKKTVPALHIEFEIIYFNSSSSKLFFELFDVLNEAKGTMDIVVSWHYHEENESALEAGEDFVADFPELDIRLLSTAK
jgi:hypothetical protein